jgi:hypothetical protein
MFTITRAGAGAASLLLIGGASMLHPSRRAPVRGYTYTIHVTMSPRGAAAGAMGAMATQDWTARATSANGRGRMDITAGEAAGSWATGDYLLFDSTEFIVVHPATRQFIAVPADLASRSFDQMKANGVDVSISGVTAAMQPVSGSDSDVVAGVRTQHYKLHVTYTLGLSAGAMQQSVATQLTSDMWVANVAGLPANPFLRASSSMGVGLMHDITLKVDSVEMPMRGMMPLRSVTVTEVSGAMPASLVTEQRVEVSDLSPATVDDALFYLPQGFTAGTVPGLPLAGGDSAGSKWRRPPGAEKR